MEKRRRPSRRAYHRGRVVNFFCAAELVPAGTSVARTVMMALIDRLSLYKDLAGASPSTAELISLRTLASNRSRHKAAIRRGRCSLPAISSRSGRRSSSWGSCCRRERTARLLQEFRRSLMSGARLSRLPTASRWGWCWGDDCGRRHAHAGADTLTILGYPGLAILLFLVAAAGGFWMAWTILAGDVRRVR